MKIAKNYQNTGRLQTQKKPGNIIESILCYLIGLAGIAACSGIVYFMAVMLFVDYCGILCNKDVSLAMLAISYQVIFLTTTLLTGLSDKSETIYWERFTEYVLVNPFIFNFRGMSCIAFLTLVVETGAFFCEGVIGSSVFYGSFVLGIVVIVWMSSRMSSIYFNREHFRRGLYRKNPKPEYDKLVNLKDNTIVAAQGQNSRIVKENLELLALLLEDKDNSSNVTKVMLELFESLTKQDDCSEYMDLIVNCVLRATDNPADESSIDTVFWIMHDPVRIGIWDKCIDVLERTPGYKVNRFYDCLREYKKHILGLLPTTDDILSDAANLVEEFDDEKKLEIARNAISEYERNILPTIDFMLVNKRPEEFEIVLAIFLEDPDPIRIYPKPYPHLDPRKNGLMLSLIEMYENDERKITDLILTYSIVVFTMAHSTIKYNPKRDDPVAARLTKYFFDIDKPDENLIEIYHAFMTEITHTGGVKEVYIEKLAKNIERVDDYGQRIKNIISYDSWLWESALDYDLYDDNDDDGNKDLSSYVSSFNDEIAFWNGILNICKKSSSHEDVTLCIEDYIARLKDYIEQIEQKMKESKP